MSQDGGLDCAAGAPPAAPFSWFRIIEKASEWLASAMSILSGGLFLVMTALVVLQVVFRYVLNAPLVGSEEAARIAMIFVVLIGAALCVRNGSHMAVTYFADRFPPWLHFACRLLVIAGIVTLSLILIVYGMEFANRAQFMKSPALQIPRGYIVWAFPLGGALMLLFAVEATFQLLLGIEPKRHEEFVE